MQVEYQRVECVYVKERKKRRKHRTLFFSSSRALRRSRMKGKKVVSKIVQETPGALCKILSFGERESAGQVDTLMQELEAVAESSQENSSVQTQPLGENIGAVSICES